MQGFARWFDQLAAMLARELAPSSRKFRTALRMTTIATVGAALVAICHVNNQLGTYIVWLLVGAGPMMAPRKAITFLIAEAIALSVSIVVAGILVETPWLILPFLFASMSLITYVGATRNFGSALLLIQVVCLDTFYTVVFAPDQIGWGAAGAFGGSVIAFGLIVLFDNWLWPDRGEELLLESLGASVARDRSRLLEAANFYLDPQSAPRPPLPPPTSDLPTHVALLHRAGAEGVSAHRRAILLAAITRVARIGLEADRLIFAARQNVPGEIRVMVRPEIKATVAAIAEVLDEIAHELPAHIAVGADQPPPASRTRVRSMLENLGARILQVRPSYIGKASAAELENFADFTDSLAALTGHLERLLDEPPQPPAAAPANGAAPRTTDAPDPALVRFSLKVGACVVVGYALGLLTQRADLSTILTTVLITALPTYGAALRKMVLRIVGAIIGGAVSLLAIIIVTPNVESLSAYLLAVFIVFYVSAYTSLASGRVAYAGKQIGTTFALVFAGLSPALDVYEPLWRTWGILLGTLVVAIVTFVLWPEYAGDSLLPRLRKVIRDTISIVPGGSAANTENDIQQANSGTMRALAEILEVADDAQVEGRSSTVNHRAIVEAAGTLRRIANRLASIATARIVTPVPQLDPVTESARAAVLDAIRRHLQSWLDFFGSAGSLSAPAAQAIAQAHLSDELAMPIGQFSSRLEEREFARTESWTLEQRRAVLAELHSMRRVEYLISELNRWLARIPGPASNLAR
ncbi:MAG: FUSC family protein [Candidatus Binataceae bacterium]|nr:FUSC family protein [Candidatus Binataceae bacterium]